MLPFDEMGDSARLVLGVLVLAGFTSGCTSVCTSADCEDNLTVRVSITTGESDASSGPGTYAFEVTSDVGTVTATCVYGDPGTPCECVVDGETIGDHGDCTATLSVTLSISNPQSVSVRALKDGVEFASRDATPEYRRFTPNGEGCPPTCTQAQPLTFAL